ncbi:MAG: hypothetical protein R3279_11200 [Putridiphycobacter sp.]|nr:hypothetical protein [Putridiphycobacter sp.]
MMKLTMKIMVVCALLLALSGCRKARFKTTPTIIRITNIETYLYHPRLIIGEKSVIESLKSSSSVTFWDKVYQFDFVDAFNENVYYVGNTSSAGYSGASSSVPFEMDNDNHTLTLTIDWNNSSSGEKVINKVNPKNELSFILIHETSNYSDFDFSIYENPKYFQKAKLIGEIDGVIKPRHIYEWNMTEDTFEDTGEKYSKNSTKNDQENDLIGKWSAVNSCENANGQSNYFHFQSGGSGTSFSADCANACPGYGVKFHFNWTATNNEIKINWTGVDDYCGVSSNTPDPETISYSLSGSTLTLNGVDYQK